MLNVYVKCHGGWSAAQRERWVKQFIEQTRSKSLNTWMTHPIQNDGVKPLAFASTGVVSRPFSRI